MKQEKETKERIRRTYAKAGARSQKSITFRLDLESADWLDQQTNKGRYINNLIADDREKRSSGNKWPGAAQAAHSHKRKSNHKKGWIMKKQIVTTRLKSKEYVALRNYMRERLRESFSYFDDTNKSWLLTCSYDEYFNEFVSIYDEYDDTKLGEGLDIISHAIVLNDETRNDFVDAFNEARAEIIREVNERYK